MRKKLNKKLPKPKKKKRTYGINPEKAKSFTKGFTKALRGE